jgi:hypothetical protein
MSHTVIYFPGLGDEKTDKAQMFMLSFWKIYGLNPVYHPMIWIDKKSFSEKLESILEEVDSYIAKGDKVSLVGVSAGGSIAINVYAQRRKDIYRVACVCGKLKNPQTIRESTYSRNLAFKGSLAELEKSLPSLSNEDRRKILSLSAIRDQQVPPADTIIEGARSGKLPMTGHVKSITYALTFGSHRIAKFFKS